MAMMRLLSPRTFGPDNAAENYAIVKDYLKARGDKSRIIAIGLGGQESGNPARAYKKVFRQAREDGLHVVAHAGEEVGPESIWEAIRDLKAERLGHCTSAPEDPKLMKYLADKKIPIEVNATSNIVTGKYYKNWADHPVGDFYRKGLNVTMNTDDPVLFDIELNEEVWRLVRYQDFTLGDIHRVLANNIEAAFLDADRKAALRTDLDAAFARAATGKTPV